MGSTTHSTKFLRQPSTDGSPITTRGVLYNWAGVVNRPDVGNEKRSPCAWLSGDDRQVVFPCFPVKRDASVDLGPLHTSVIFAVTSIWRRAFPFSYFCMLQKLQTPIYSSGFCTQSFYYLHDFLLPTINWTRKETLRSFIMVLCAFLKERSVHLKEDEFVNIYRYKSMNCSKK